MVVGTGKVVLVVDGLSVVVGHGGSVVLVVGPGVPPGLQGIVVAGTEDELEVVVGQGGKVVLGAIDVVEAPGGVVTVKGGADVVVLWGGPVVVVGAGVDAVHPNCWRSWAKMPATCGNPLTAAWTCRRVWQMRAVKGASSWLASASIRADSSTEPSSTVAVSVSVREAPAG